MKVLVTGGAGFIGSHLCRHLLQKGYSVTCLDNLNTGFKQNIDFFHSYPEFSFIEADVRDEINIDVDVVFNLACPASPSAYQKDPIGTLMTNVVGTFNVLNLAMRCGATVIQASTSEVYGDPDVHPQSEKYWGNVNPIGLRSCYDEGKRAAETLCFDFMRTKNLSVKVARIFNTYGPGMDVDDGRVISNFIVQALRGDPILVFGDGTQTRSFCYVDDLVKGIILLSESDTAISGPINIGNPTETSIIELAHIVKKLTKSSSSIEYRYLPEDDPKKRKPDISQAIDLLLWQPEISLDDGIASAIDHFRKIIK
ncbi:UDP-glucuronic acid decarboxylase family protein [Rhizobium sp. SL86]|uniref:UDP-glucuronic acid decarboxylase family protein n=1 Tax=Rhizobium sp. SL86 TaxID=2995148 RepID=UPI0022728B87|nr:UDP-glucuronic acid decarboxylase family protein [Rhizobium sp. SL86]MCY1666601.1 SDR family oxidoreductase [Rhizobium sp. SL86]